MFKHLLVLALVAAATIEAKYLSKKLESLETAFASRSAHRITEHVRRRRDAEAAKSGEDTSSEEAEIGANLLKFVIAAGWQADKLDMLSEFLQEMTDTDTNLTVVAWQRVLDGDGEVKEIRTVQLVIPPKPEDPDARTNIAADEDEDDEEGMPHKQIAELRAVLGPLDVFGSSASATSEEFDKEGNEIALLYFDGKQLWNAVDQEVALYNKTAVASTQEVSNFINSLKPAAFGKPSVLKYDVDGNLLPDQSHIRPQILGGVMYFNPNTTYNIVREGHEIIARISYQYPKAEIPKQLSLHYNKAYPQYKWRVLDDPKQHYITRDVEVGLISDFWLFDESNDVTYCVYGVKK